MARVALVSCIILFGAHHLNTFRIQVGVHQIIYWYAPFIFLNYLVCTKSFGAHRFISESSIIMSHSLFL